MKLEEYKSQLENRQPLPKVLIFKCKGKEHSEFLFHQYLNRYAEDNNIIIEYIEDLSKLYNGSSLFNTYMTTGSLYVYTTDKLESIDIDTIKDNLWIRCKTVDKKIASNNEDIIIELPNLEDWHIKDYIDFNVPALSKEGKDKLFSNYKSNPFRLENEIAKLTCFEKPAAMYKQIENQLFVDSTQYSVFDVTNCLLRRDFRTLDKIKHTLSIIDIDAFGLLKILTTNFKYVIDIQLSRNPTPEYVGVSSKQFWAIKNYSCNIYTKEELVYIYQMLLTLDIKIKSGYISTEDVIDYIICKIMLLR